MKNLQPFIKLLRNKYVVVLLCFVLWMLFFDPKDIGLVWKRQNKLNELRKSEQQVTKQIVTAKNELKWKYYIYLMKIIKSLIFSF